jgi:hypothetical protein
VGLEGLGCGQRDEGGLDQGGVLGGAAALDPGAASLVVGEGEVAAVVGTAFEAVEVLLVAPGLAVGVDDGGEVEAELLERGGVELLGLGQQGLGAAGA